MSEAAQMWKAFAKSRDITLEPGGILVRFPDGRGHRLRVIDGGEHWLLTGLVVRYASEKYDEPALAAAVRNRRLKLCGFRVNEHDRLVGQSCVPKAGLSAAEFQFYARHLAAECDRLEHLLTGRDREGI